MEEKSIAKLLLKLAPPVMLALLIMSIYNIVDSYFVASYSQDGLNALSIIYPIQLLMTALSTGVGSGINIIISRMDGMKDNKSQGGIIKSGLILGIIDYIIFSSISMIFLKGFVNLSSNIENIQKLCLEYGYTIILFSLGMFVEANCTKILQAKGRMILPMIAQITGAITNIILDPILIFGKLGFPELGVKGAGIATVLGQTITMIIVLIAVLKSYSIKGKFSIKDCISIYKKGLPSIALQSLYTVYIIGLNLILKGFTEDAVSVLGIYYKEQSFFIIPLMGLQQVILPIISYNYGANDDKKIKQTLWYSTIVSVIMMFLATIVFMIIPDKLVLIFSSKPEVLKIGQYALRIISLSFVPIVFSMLMPIYFQGIECPNYSIFIVVLRQIALFVPLAWILHFFGLFYVWFTFPLTDTITAITSIILYKKENSKMLTTHNTMN